MIAVLRQSGLYSRLKASWLYDFYWRMRDPALIKRISEEIEFYRDLLSEFQRGDLIIDVGANVGDKADVFLKLGARVVAVEPDTSNQRIIRDRFLRYRLAPKPVTVVGKALSDKDGVETMWIDEPGCALNTLSRKWVDTLRSDKASFAHTHAKLEFSGHQEIETTTLEQVISAHGDPIFIKIDVEGFEPMVLRGLRHPVPYVSFEVNLPEFRPEGLECVNLLGKLAPDGIFNYTKGEPSWVQERWLGQQEFSQVLDQCADKSIEVFWKRKGR